MVKCAVPSCKNDSRKQTKKKNDISFHRFPKSRDVAYKWVEAIIRPNLEPNNRSFVCSINKLQVQFDVPTLRSQRDLPCMAFMWAYIKNSTRAERLCCSVATVMLALSISLAVYFTVFYNMESDTPRDSEGWFISRDEWLADQYDNADIEPAFEPIPLVSIQHSVSNECNRFTMCAAEMRNLQEYFILKLDRDIPYNFLIGNDGRVYEGRGWRKEGAHTKHYNKCTVGIGFIGDYREEKGTYTQVTQMQKNNMYKLLEEGVEKGFLFPDYQIVAALDVTNTASPGSNLYKAMQLWPHYDHPHRYRNKSCQEISHSIMALSDRKR